MARHMCETSPFEHVLSMLRKIRESRFVAVGGVNLRLSLEHSENEIEDHLLRHAEPRGDIVSMITLSSAIVPYAIGDWLDEENQAFGMCRPSYVTALSYSSDGHFRSNSAEDVDVTDWPATMSKMASGLVKSERLFDSLANFVMDHLDYERGHDIVIDSSAIRTKRRVHRLEDGVIYESGIRGTRNGEWLLLQTYSQRRQTLPWKGQPVVIEQLGEKTYRPCSLNINFMQVLRDAQRLRSDRPMELALTSARQEYKRFLQLANIPTEAMRG